nr:GNAT family N-acetyltransferase [bacterium]
MTIKKAQVDDLQEILDLQYLAYQSEAKLFNHWDIPPLKQSLADIQNEYRRGVVLKAVDEAGHIIGSVRGYAADGTVYIGKLMVHPKKQGQGIGTKLLLAMEQKYPNQRYQLFTSTRSKKNILFYEKRGYKICDTRKVDEALQLIYLEKYHAPG